MKLDSRFELLDKDTPMVAVNFDGQVLMLPDGANLAAALMAAGGVGFGQARGEARAPYCMMGVCFDCLIVVDGVARQACMMEVRAGLNIAPADQAGAAHHDAM